MTTDIRSLKAIQLDALREVANIGAGHAATALSQMTGGGTIMISVPRVNVVALEDIPFPSDKPEEPVAAVLLTLMGDITGRALLVFPRETAQRLVRLMLGARADDAEELSPLARSALQEAGNILSSAYLNALSEFMGMMILPSPPSLAIDMSAAIVTAAYLQLPPERDVVLCVESEFTMQEVGERLRGFFLLLPDAPSLDAILRAVRVA